MEDTSFIRDKEKNSSNSIFRDLMSSLRDLIRSEIRLAKIELRDTTTHLGRQAVQAAFFFILTILGIFPLLAFFVIGLGQLLNNNYLISSLIVALFCMTIGGILAVRSYMKIKQQDLTLPHTRHTIENEIERVDKKIHQIYDGAKRKN